MMVNFFAVNVKKKKEKKMETNTQAQEALIKIQNITNEVVPPMKTAKAVLKNLPARHLPGELRQKVKNIMHHFGGKCSFEEFKLQMINNGVYGTNIYATVLEHNPSYHNVIRTDRENHVVYSV